MDLQRLISELNQLVPETLAESWDNVGLLVEPTPPHQVQKLLLTNDLTEPVLDEATEKQVDLILSYHPPIFRPLKHLTCASWKEKIIVRCLEKRIAVYSPHTALDAVLGGVNDWLLEPFDVAEKCPILQSCAPVNKDAYTHCVNIHLADNPRVIDTTLDSLKDMQYRLVRYGSESSLVSIYCIGITSVTKVIRLLENCQAPVGTISVMKHDSIPLPGYGMGRSCMLKAPLTLREAIDRIKQHLGIPFVRVALPESKSLDSEVHKIAVCAGSGASVLRGADADLYVSGEMSHHEVLDAVHGGRIVVLCEHSNTERGYLEKFRTQLANLLPSVQIVVSETDRDPLTVL